MRATQEKVKHRASPQCVCVCVGGGGGGGGAPPPLMVLIVLPRRGLRPPLL
eukprot:SAG11_NODE_33960_length_274_cov_1.154286_1_plen_50_part_10